MKKIVSLALVALVLLLSALSMLSDRAAAAEIGKTLTLDIEAADLGGHRRDTVTSNVEELLPPGKDWLYLYRTWQLSRMDTLFAADTIYLITQTAPTEVGPWTKFDSTKIIPTRTIDTTYDTTIVASDTTVDTSFNYLVRDTLINFAVRLKLDSTAVTTHARYLRFQLVNGITLGSTAADSAIVGRKYDLRVALHLFGRY